MILAAQNRAHFVITCSEHPWRKVITHHDYSRFARDHIAKHREATGCEQPAVTVRSRLERVGLRKSAFVWTVDGIDDPFGTRPAALRAAKRLAREGSHA